MAATLKTLPPSERLWLTVTSVSGAVFYITSKDTRDAYYIYVRSDSGYVRLGKGKTPPELENKFVK